jgi:hypothetical protein
MSPPIPPAWRPDPLARHQYRYHDGDGWTPHVSDDGIVAVDPMLPPARQPPPLPRAPAWTGPADQALWSKRASTGDALLRVALFLAGTGFTALTLLGSSCFVRSMHDTGRRTAEIRRLAADAPTIPSETLDEAHVGRMVHLTGVARSLEPTTDEELGTVFQALQVERTVSMYQWIETCTSSDDEPPSPGPDEYVERTWKTRRRRVRDRWEKCRYTKDWNAVPQTIAAERADRYVNPPFPFEAGTRVLPSRGWAVGKFTLPSGRLPENPAGMQPVVLSERDLGRLPAPHRARAFIADGAIRIGARGTPEVGDLKVRYRARFEMPVSVLAERDLSGVRPRTLDDGSTYIEVREGTHSVADLLALLPSGRDHWLYHVPLAACVAFGVFMTFWALRAWGRIVPGPPLLTGAGPFAFVVLASAAVYAAALARSWWNIDPRAAVIALVGAGAAVIVLLCVSALRLLLKPTEPGRG